MAANRDALFKYWSKLDEAGTGEISVEQVPACKRKKSK
jgi:hypothetical protein